MKRFTWLVLLVSFFPTTVFAQGVSVGIQASVVHTDFSPSWATLAPKQNGSYEVAIHVENVGALASKDTKLELVLPADWRYEGTSGGGGLLTTEDRSYGQQVDWQLDPVAGGSSRDMAVVLTRTESGDASPLFISLSSAYSVPVYTQVVQTGEKKTAWTSWVRSVGEYATLTVREFWYRIKTGIRLGLGNS